MNILICIRIYLLRKTCFRFYLSTILSCLILVSIGIWLWKGRNPFLPFPCDPVTSRPKWPGKNFLFFGKFIVWQKIVSAPDHIKFTRELSLRRVSSFLQKTSRVISWKFIETFCRGVNFPQTTVIFPRNFHYLLLSAPINPIKCQCNRGRDWSVATQNLSKWPGPMEKVETCFYPSTAIHQLRPKWDRAKR